MHYSETTIEQAMNPEKQPPSPEIATSDSDDRLSAFLESGFYRFDDANAYFIDPVRVLNRSYTRFRVSPAAYYSRFFPSPDFSTENPLNSSRKRKRREKEKKKTRNLNSREQLAERRHQEVTPALLKAHEALLGASKLLKTLRNLRDDGENNNCESISRECELDLVELGSVWQAPFYEIVLNSHDEVREGGNAGVEYDYQRVIPVFGNLVVNEGTDEIESELLDHKYILPKRSCFYMSDLRRIHNMIPAESDCGFNLIMIDPPWENSSAHQKQKYRTMPNRHFLSLPIKQITHTSGALVALWVTNREKLREFVEIELFPKWGIEYASTFYWLKVKADGLLISELDLFHHRPYECLLLGYSHGKEMDSEQMRRLKGIPDSQVFISVPGDYSRKPPIGELLMDYVPGLKPARCVELFAREMTAGWASWGNEPLHFQDSRYFIGSKDK